ncbi:MAG: hypothetical protein AAF196_04720 [Planctomycetota bacterium]
MSDSLRFSRGKDRWAGRLARLGLGLAVLPVLGGWCPESAEEFRRYQDSVDLIDALVVPGNLLSLIALYLSVFLCAGALCRASNRSATAGSTLLKVCAPVLLVVGFLVWIEFAEPTKGVIGLVFFTGLALAFVAWRELNDLAETAHKSSGRGHLLPEAGHSMFFAGGMISGHLDRRRPGPTGGYVENWTADRWSEWLLPDVGFLTLSAAALVLLGFGVLRYVDRVGLSTLRAVTMEPAELES